MWPTLYKIILIEELISCPKRTHNLKYIHMIHPIFTWMLSSQKLSHFFQITNFVLGYNLAFPRLHLARAKHLFIYLLQVTRIYFFILISHNTLVIFFFFFNNTLVNFKPTNSLNNTLVTSSVQGYNVETKSLIICDGI